MRWGALSAAATALLSLGALLTALTVTPLGDAIRDRVFDEESGYCSAGWLEAAQVFPPALALLISLVGIRARSRPWRCVAAALGLLVLWFVIGALGDCALSSDDG
jgi:hypothetical protein